MRVRCVSGSSAHRIDRLFRLLAPRYRGMYTDLRFLCRWPVAVRCLLGTLTKRIWSEAAAVHKDFRWHNPWLPPLWFLSPSHNADRGDCNEASSCKENRNDSRGNEGASVLLLLGRRIREEGSTGVSSSNYTPTVVIRTVTLAATLKREVNNLCILLFRFFAGCARTT